MAEHSHSWVPILELNATDYDPGYVAYWCKCGEAKVIRFFDNRVIKEKFYKPGK